jgi:predicted enzyme related to lactoylglutathione lyase
MSELVIGMTLDCNDIVRVAAFWRDALRYEEAAPARPDATFHGLVSPAGRGGLHHLTLQRVPEVKAAKNRVHIDLFVADVDVEVDRLVSLGASVVVPARSDGPFVTAVLGDPEGSEFCVVQRAPSP